MSVASSRSCSSLRHDHKEEENDENEVCHLCGTREGERKVSKHKVRFYNQCLSNFKSKFIHAGGLTGDKRSRASLVAVAGRR